MGSRVFETFLSFLHKSEQHVEDLMDLGGPVMWPLLAVSLLLWTLVLERYWFFLRTLPRFLERRVPLVRSPAAVIEMKIALRRHLRLIKTLSGILPMLGLLGTVTGIIETFDLIRVFGSAETRIVARGVSQALITTLAGLVMGLFGVGVGYNLNRRARAFERRYADRLRQP
ncbi:MULTISPECIES: MotA/TolQ/ExbB proton channel family protein [unclassified Methylocaldum]|jgi:biopolymer transport protein ExbB|uniref:MotA/TolQ/ExbB proton channel family protein n=1 Tax=unclassified Methylocaldum TaxID=2622260 RepID=UPI00098A532F|nr:MULTISPECIES: MotA/TolQ/ExbB proton channel family protein [unclassified Methylocaldum]MBP1151411.1 biopolymer transport protein ExbB [Methylocaldum sp. RMAD-M]MDV3242768.1 MotA/TolQ/ExbB proton channel family protein [Methylocaldum sp.]